MRRVVLFVGIAVVAACGESTAVGGGPTQFEPEAWRAAAPDARGRMCPDLLSKHQLLGLSLEGVTELLGEPDSSNHYVWYWVGPTSDPEHSAGRFKIYFKDGLVTSFHRDGLPQLRPARVAFDRKQWLAASNETRLAMLDGALALESEFLGRLRADVEDFFGPPSVRWHDADYALSPAEDPPGDWLVYRQRLLSLRIDADGRITEAVDHEVSD